MTEIIVAPFSNNPLRDWPAAHYSAAIGLLLDRLPSEARISVVGTRGQRLCAAEIVRPFPADRVFNDCGIAWDVVLDKVRHASCVIGNNSGISHASQYLGAPTLCIFGGSHQRSEWGPLGDNVVILSRAIGCSPCQFNHASECPYGAACLRDIAPSAVAAAAVAMIAQADSRSGAGDGHGVPAPDEQDERKAAIC